MTETVQPASATPAFAPDRAAANPSPHSLRGAGRLRAALYLAFAVLALAGTVYGLRTLHMEEVHTADAEILDRAGSQRVQSQQIGRVAALCVAEPAARRGRADELRAVLAQSRDDARVLDAQVMRQLSRAGSDVPRTESALQAWRSARERLWDRADALLRLAEGTDEPALLRSNLALQAEATPVLAATTQLSTLLREASVERAEGLRRQTFTGICALLVLLGLLSLLVVEPTSRSVRRHAERLRLQAAELRSLALVAEHTSAMVLITDAGDLLRWANAAFTQISGWTLAEAVGRRPGELMSSPQADDAALRRVHHALRAGQGLRQEWLHSARDGRDLWLDVDLRPLRNEAGELEGFVRVCSDVTARALQQAKLQALWAALPAGMVVQGPGGEIVEANRAAEQLLGLSLAQLQGVDSLDPCWRAVRPDGSPYPGVEHPAMRTLASGQPLRNETIGIHLPDGQLRWLMVNTEPQLDRAGHVSGVVACFSDITEGRMLQDRLSDSARTDVLTRLPNRAVVMERLERAIMHARRHPGYGFAVLFMDFDRFKQVNDTLGHSAGDELLRQIAERLRVAVRPGDAVARIDADPSDVGQVAARLGGDEFVVVLDGVHTTDAAKAIAQRLLQELAEPYLIGCNPVQSSASIGVVLCPPADGATVNPLLQADLGPTEVAEEVLRNADTAMYEAKRAGRGRWVLFDETMHERVVRALAMENDLRRALKDDELFVVYQPVVDLETQAMVGVEALVRWRHPTRGLVQPVEFIGVAEECGLIDALGAVVLQKSCDRFMGWQRTLGQAAPRLLAVNLSRAQLDRGGLVDEVRRVLHDNGMSASQLQLEVTESLAAQDEHVQATLRELKGLGVRLALDDFGTGYSSLACLHQLPVDTVKIDRSFVRHAETVEYHRVLIEATIRVARTLGMTTVAEGIETLGQAALMQVLDCDRGQGYLYSRPLEPAELERWANAQAQRLAEREAADTA